MGIRTELPPLQCPAWELTGTVLGAPGVLQESNLLQGLLCNLQHRMHVWDDLYSTPHQDWVVSQSCSKLQRLYCYH
jgi:hypothetical protein